jgi:hypothetical protein
MHTAFPKHIYGQTLLPVFATHLLSNILLVRSVHYRPLHHDEHRVSCTTYVVATDSKIAHIASLVLLYLIVSELPCTKATATATEYKSNELLFSTANYRLNFTAFTNAYTTEDLLFTKHSKQIETQTARCIHVHAQLNARAVAGCSEVL